MVSEIIILPHCRNQNNSVLEVVTCPVLLRLTGALSIFPHGILHDPPLPRNWSQLVSNANTNHKSTITPRNQSNSSHKNSYQYLRQHISAMTDHTAIDDSLSSTGSTVSFGSVEIREYERILVGCEKSSMGLGIGWEYHQRPTRPVDQHFGPSREYSKPTYCGYRDASERLQLLSDYGFTMRELLHSERERREQAINNDGRENDSLPPSPQLRHQQERKRANSHRGVARRFSSMLRRRALSRRRVVQLSDTYLSPVAHS